MAAAFERFLAWRLCHQLALDLSSLADGFPPHERYALAKQVRTAAYSAAANIAEGASKRGRREFARYLDIAIGSIGELRYALVFARDRGYIDSPCYQRFENQRNHAGAITWKLYQAIRNGRGQP